ncbi:hypothetical protein GUJ93_ZPchr0008g13276 [Zizania palustris]|uniref:Uncharacterized protein n=1 Tax=Zizania palustris TaxID=103762 RepID=A0A8J5RUI1_ZIZPA|nr:hypothetical protein GUJ93_ZPchr0008g13276 [Zizania palustris]
MFLEAALPKASRLQAESSFHVGESSSSAQSAGAAPAARAQWFDGSVQAVCAEDGDTLLIGPASDGPLNSDGSIGIPGGLARSPAQDGRWLWFPKHIPLEASSLRLGFPARRAEGWIVLEGGNELRIEKVGEEEGGVVLAMGVSDLVLVVMGEAG